MGYRVVQAADLSWDERPFREGEGVRLTADLTTQAAIEQSRARIWRIPPHTRGRRHKELVQEEVFVVLSGTLTLLLDDPPNRVDLGPHGVACVDAGTGVQMRNESDEDVVVLAYGAPPVGGQAEYLDDVEL